ncbi:hypothetical protein B0T26DRAFT_176663 [Lasiosphaeria miniovina]|uniref:Uncharacterized protein n=1 Tax=Lasiosphaeria miniovina TaxID=1954250 RepID=A0AA40E921_9PEZI|nr:uncharacterized protein B0T26DRAFT_176663 [Lasiosphaeria miniovina]KAK0728556.1 hypothetical protein B0T26DRAFT_176663 [Lasiosphaeria miniovina]
MSIENTSWTRSLINSSVVSPFTFQSSFSGQAHVLPAASRNPPSQAPSTNRRPRDDSQVCLLQTKQAALASPTGASSTPITNGIPKDHSCTSGRAAPTATCVRPK